MPPPKRRRRTLVRRSLVALAVGVALTVGIAWIAMFLPWGNQWYGPPPTEPLGLARDTSSGYPKLWQIDRGRNAWHTVVRYWFMQVSGIALSIPESDFEARKFDMETLPSRLRPTSLGDLKMMAWYHETGFPLKSMSCSVHWKTQIRNEDVIYSVRGGVQLPRDAGFNPRALPLRPVWIGFVVDVLVWGGAWMLLASAVRALRARLSAKRGRCVQCGYPRQGLSPGARCPECGRAQ